MFTACAKCGFMYDNESGACPQCCEKSPETPAAIEAGVKPKEKKLSNLFGKFKKKNTTPEANTENVNTASDNAPMISVVTNTVNADDFTIDASSLASDTVSQAAIQESQDDIATVAVNSTKNAPVAVYDPDSTPTVHITINNDIISTDDEQTVRAPYIKGEEIKEYSSDADETPTVAAIPQPNSEAEVDAVITVEKSNDTETVYANYNPSQNDIEDVSSTSFVASSVVATSDNEEVSSSDCNITNEVDTTYTIINDTGIAHSKDALKNKQPIAPVQPLPVEVPDGYRPVEVTPMVSSAPDSTEKNDKPLIILLVSILLGIVIIGGIALTLIR